LTIELVRVVVLFVYYKPRICG